MGIFKRISTIFKSEANAALDKLEDPEKILNQSILDMQTSLNNAKKQVAVAIADEKRLQKQYEDELAKAQEWERKAMQAVNAGRDDLATQALGRKQEHDNNAAEFHKQWQLQKAGTDKIRAKLKEMSNKIEEMKRQKNLLIAKHRRAEATKTISNTLAGIDDGGAASAFERMKEKVEKNEAEAAASEELALDYTGGDDLEKEFSSLKADPAAQNDALAALKAKMGKGPAPAAQAPYASNNYGTNNLSNANSWDDL